MKHIRNVSMAKAQTNCTLDDLKNSLLSVVDNPTGGLECLGMLLSEALSKTTAQ